MVSVRFAKRRCRAMLPLWPCCCSAQPSKPTQPASKECPRWPLLLASFHGHASVVRELLRHPDIQVNANAELNGGLATLVFACDQGHLDSVRVLLLHPELDTDSIRAAFDKAEKQGQTALVALLEGHPAVGDR